MAINTIKQRIHIASCAELADLLTEARGYVADNPSLENWFRIHFFKEYNRRNYFLCGGGAMITPFDGGLKPTGDLGSAETSDALLLEDGTDLLLEDETQILLESIGSDFLSEDGEEFVSESGEAFLFE
jgi:hypothetical protein